MKITLDIPDGIIAGFFNHLDKVKRQTGLDPRRFYDLVELVKMAQEVLESGS